MKLEEINKTIGVIFETIKRQRQANDYFGLLTSGVACLEYSYKLIEVMVNAEAEYRKEEAKYINEDFTSSKAESLAKATEAYKNYKQATYLHDTLLEMNMTCKKLAVGNEKELKSN